MANIQETKIFLGGMDKDNSPESVNQYDYIDAHNVRNVGKEGGDENYLVNLEGTQLITQTLPLGINKAIGTRRFETVGKSYTVKYNSQGYHQIVEFDYESEIETVVFQNLTDSNNVNVFPITANNYFTDIRLMHEDFLILNNGTSPIFCLNVKTLKTNRGTIPVVQDDLLLSKKPPLAPPVFRYANDTNRTANSLKGNLFQFRYQYEYEDFRSSAWSTISKRVVPIDEPANGQGQNVALYNVLEVRVKVGTDRVENVNIAVRTGNNNWLLVKTVERDYITSLPNSTITVGTNTEAYDASTGEYIFLFYNDGLYPIIDQIEVDSLYDHVPHSAESVEVINGNLLAVGGLEEGYDRPEIQEVIITGVEYAPNISATTSGGGDFDFAYLSYYRQSGVQWQFYRVHFKGVPQQGDVIHMRMKPKNQVTWGEYTYTVTATDEINGLTYTLQQAGNSFSAQKPSGTGNIVGQNDNLASIDFSDNSSREYQFFIVRENIGTLSTQSINTLKTNSSYQLALAYYDQFGRPFPIVTDDRFIVKTQSLAYTQGNLTQINWAVQQKAPEGAASYQWLLSENQTHLSSIYLTGKYDSGQSTENYLAFEIKSLERFLGNEAQSQVNYSFTKGDKVTFIYTTNGNNRTVEKWFRYPFIELDIVDFKLQEDPQNVGNIKYILKVRATDLLKTTDIDNKDIMMELYTPKGRSVDTESIFFYEIGEQYPIVNGNHSVMSGSIREGDWYFRGRLYESNITENTAIPYLVEDPNFSDNYESKYYSFGRARTYNDEDGRVFKKASIRYSDEYIYGSKFNGISRFYFERIYGELGGQTTSVYGAIKRLEMRDNSLVCIQEFKVGIIPVYKSIIFDNTDTSLVADSGKIFGSVQYRNGNYGCGDAKESVAVSRDGLIYFIDDNNCVPVRDSLSGIQIIDVNLHREFIKYVKRAKDNLQRIIGIFDDNFNEYNVTLSDNSNEVVTIDFSSNEIIFNENFTIPSSSISIIGVVGGTVTLNNGVATFTPQQNFIGEAQFTWQYTFNGTVYNNIEYINYITGDSVPDQFTFIGQTNQQLNTVIESNEIVVSGINMPTTVSVTGGEYSKNGGAWTSASGTAVLGDYFKVRQTSSSENSTMTTVTLNIGTTVANFNVTTIPSGVTPNEYLTIYGEAFLEESTGALKVKLDMSHTLPVIYSITGYVTYNDFGSDQVTPNRLFRIPVGQTSTTTDMGVSLIRSSQIKSGTLILNTSSLTNGSVVMCQDGQNRIVQILPEMELSLGE